MMDVIGYLGVSTAKQGRSGLGLAAQRCDIEAFGACEGLSIKSWHQDIQTGAGKDGLLLRPGLAAALKEARAALPAHRLEDRPPVAKCALHCRAHGAQVNFVVALFGRDIDNFTLHIYASLAEKERRMISERVKAAAQIAKRKGRKSGLQLRSKSRQRCVSAMGRAALPTKVYPVVAGVQHCTSYTAAIHMRSAVTSGRGYRQLQHRETRRR
jgi:DNA invertase Pin-like site-specific DNA recombinase